MTEVLGPVVHRWLLGLEHYTAYFSERPSAFLYCARAGVRIRRLHALHATGRGRPLTDAHRVFWSSRVALCKALYHRVPERSAALLAREYHDHPLRDLVRGLLRNAPEELARLDLASADLDAHGHQFPGWITSDFPAAAALRAHFKACGAAFERHFEEVTGGAERLVLIDSGWQGSAQSLISRAFPDRDVHGLYVGRILSDSHDPGIADRVIGLLFESERYDPARPETALTAHRHLIESLLEPNGRSVEEVPGGPCAEAAERQIHSNAEEKVSPTRDRLFTLVERYLSARAGTAPSEILARYHAALPELARLLVFPDRIEALALAGKDRSADFGKALAVPVLVAEPGDAPHTADAHARIGGALWRQGQVALEYDGRMRTEIQRQVTGLTDGAAHFDPAGAATPVPAPALRRGRPAAAIVTRTKNRPLLLRRAAESVAGQSLEDYEWVVVNDGGDEDVVREVIGACPVDRRRIRLVSNAESRGMEAASNLGIAETSARYLLIHDDDDTLHRDFLQKTVAFLDGPGGRRYGGVVTGAEYVSEEIAGDRVIEHGRQPYMDWVKNIQFAELMAQNLFAPIAFLYRREIYDAVGGYNEDLPVLGDWYFNLEFLLQADIAVLPETLAGYHHRDKGDSSKFGLYANSVIGGRSKHLEFAAVMRNAFLRRHGRTDPVAASAAAAYFSADLRARLDRLEAQAREARPAAPRPSEPPAQDPKLLAEIDRLWALTRLLSGPSAAVSGRGGMRRPDASNPAGAAIAPRKGARDAAEAGKAEGASPDVAEPRRPEALSADRPEPSAPCRADPPARPAAAAPKTKAGPLERKPGHSDPVATRRCGRSRPGLRGGQSAASPAPPAESAKGPAHRDDGPIDGGRPASASRGGTRAEAARCPGGIATRPRASKATGGTETANRRDTSTPSDPARRSGAAPAAGDATARQAATPTPPQRGGKAGSGRAGQSEHSREAPYLIAATATLDEIGALMRRRAITVPPHPTFDESAYLCANPDVAEAVSRGDFASGYEHFLLHGQDEGRARPVR